MVRIAGKAREESVAVDVGDQFLPLLVGDGLPTFSFVGGEEGALGHVCKWSCTTIGMLVGMCTLRRELRLDAACAVAMVQTRWYMAIDATIGIARCGAVTGFGERVRLRDLRRCMDRR